MSKCYSSFVERTTKILFVLVLISFGRLQAQTDISIGTGTTGNTGTSYPAPIQDWYEGSRAQYLYRASDLIAAGMSVGNITAIKFNVTNLNTFSGNIQQYTVRIGNTATASLSVTAWEPSPATVFGPVDYVPTLGVNTITFTTPFFWNGTDNILIEICNGLPGNEADGITHYTNNVTVPWTTAVGYNASHTRTADNDGNLCSTTTTTDNGTETNRPNITFTWTPASACSGTPTGGTANSNKAVACLGENFTLSATGVTVASGLTYQWQSSPDNATWTDIPGGNTFVLTTSQSATSYYRLVVTCTNGGGIANSTSVQVTSPALVFGTFTINKDVATGGTNFASFNDAYNYIKCGISGPVVFNVTSPLASGPYNEQLIMNAVPGASATNTVIFNGTGQTISYTSTTSGQRAVIKLDGADHVTFNNLVIEAGGTTTSQYGFGVHLINDADSNRINNCIINITTGSTSTNYAGIVMSASHTSATGTGTTLSDGNIFSDNTIRGGYYGITMVGSTTSAVGNNQVVRNSILDFYNYGVYLGGNFNSLIDSNNISRPTRTTFATASYGVYMTSLNTFVMVSRNRIHNFYGNTGGSNSQNMFGIYVTGVDALGGFENKVINNAIYNTNTDGDVYGIYNLGSDNIWYLHNTIVIDGAGTTSTATDVARGFYQTTTAAGIDFKNNLIYINRGGLSTKHALYWNTSTSTIVSDYNNLYIASTTGANYTGYNGANRITLLDWQTATTQDINSISVNPLFEDASTGNYRPTNASMDNEGTALGVLVDITGAARNASTPDIGAWEFAPGPCSAPPTPGTANVSPSPVCVNNNVSLTLSGNSIGLGQTYQWQTSATAGGPYTNIGNPLTNPDTVVVATTTMFYRVAVTCGASTEYSAPVQLLVNQRMPQGTYTINSGSATNYPTGTNFISFNAAKAALQCGIDGAIIFNVVSGTGPYNEQLLLDSIPGSSATNTVTFNGNGNTIAFSSSDANQRAVITLRGADHITFDSLVIDATGSGTYGWGVQIMNNADSNVVKNSVINSSTTSTSTTNYAGIVINSSETSPTTTGSALTDGNLIEGNTVNGGYYGITVVGSTTSAVQNNRIIDNIFSNFYSYGVYLNGNLNTIVSGNNISRATRTTVTTFYGIYVTSLNRNLLIEKNRIHSPFDGNPTSTSVFNGIYFTGVDALVGFENKVINNAIYNVTGNGDEYGIYNTSSDNVHYFHNTISLDNPSATVSTSDWARGFYQTTTASGIQFKNNIISVTRGGAGDRTALYFATSGSDIESNFNGLYVAGPTADTYVGYYNGVRTTLADWQAASGQDSASRFGNPFFVDPVAGNLIVRNPVFDNMATPLGVTTDILNAPRSASAPDPGAWEFVIPPCTAPPAVGTSTAIPSSGICMGDEIRLGLNGVNTLVSGQTYQWQYSTSATGPWTNLGGVHLFPDTTIYATTTLYYQVIVTCSGQSATAAPVLVSLDPALLGGVYTIDPGQPSSATNYTSFAAAAAALECGITDDVTFNVAPGTYTEQIRLHEVAGASNNARITFQAANGDPASVILTYASTATASNYTLKLDSASYFTFRNMTINATGLYARAIEIANNASYDSLYNLVINVKDTTSTSNNYTGIFAGTGVNGSYNVIKNNRINKGSYGIYYDGASTTNYTHHNIVDSNVVYHPYNYGIYLGDNYFVTVTNNKVYRTAPTSATSYGIYGTNLDSAYNVTGNYVNIYNTTTTQYGIYLTGSAGKLDQKATVSNNIVVAKTGNTGTVYGIYQTGSSFNNTFNNVISIGTTNAASYGLYSTGGGDLRYYSNTVRNNSNNPGLNNYAAYINHTSGGGADFRNNIFMHSGSGKAMYMGESGFVSSDYNMYWATNDTLIRRGEPAGVFGTLPSWITASSWDQNSIVYKPVFNNDSLLTPDVADSTVWAMHGRGVQIEGNNRDIKNNPRPETLTQGVPDLGAYEFLPTVAPIPLQGNPVAAAPGTTQVFMFGTDTVAKITWDPATAVPSTIAVRRYSGVLPTGLSAGQQSMYFYNKFDVTGTNTPTFNFQQFYIDPWQGFIPREVQTRLGRTDAANVWIMDPLSSVDTVANVMHRNTLNFIDKFTGLTDASIVAPPPAPYVQYVDSSNRGRRFWTGYAHSWDFFSGQNEQNMVLYLGAGSQPANVTVTIPGIGWSRTYFVPANTAITSDIIPKAGLYDSRLLIEGQMNRGILIESNVPISAYAHIYANTNSGATMLLPAGAWGYEYFTLNSRQYYSSGTTAHSSFFVVADRDSTLVEITPSNPTSTGRPAGVPFTVTLMAGEVYQIMGAYINDDNGYDLTGSRIKSLPNASGDCYPIAVFAGSTRTGLGCGTNAGSSGDILFQQVFPSQAWGQRYLTAPTSRDVAASNLMTNIYRVMVKDPTTVVQRNGVTLTGLIANRYYQFESNTADRIEADKPIMVGQYMSSDGDCPNTTGDGDPEMFYISPLEQAINSSPFYRNDVYNIDENYLTLIIPDGGLSSLFIDGSQTFDHVYSHPNMTGYSVVVKRWSSGSGQSLVQSDSAFTGIVYGLGDQESYGYNVGTLVKNLNSTPGIVNILSTGAATSAYTCRNTPFRFTIQLTVKPTQMVWQFSEVAGLSPSVDSVQNNPVPVDSTFINGRWYYHYTINRDFTYSNIGTFTLPITITHPSIEGCNNSYERLLNVDVVEAPSADFTIDFDGCLDDVAQFSGTGASVVPGVTVSTYNWNFGDNTTATNNQNPTHQYTAAGNYNVRMDLVTSDGCLGQVTKPLVVSAAPIPVFVQDTVAVCPDEDATLQVQNPVTGVTYSWYNAETGGTLLHTGTSYTLNVVATTSVWVESSQAGCRSQGRTRAVLIIQPAVASPVVTVTERTPTTLTFTWNAVANATGYQVSTNGGTTWVQPSSGAMGTTHTITGLAPMTSVTLIVRALGGCEEARSPAVTAQTLTDKVFIPNSFTPNGDGNNDVLLVYGYVIRELQFMVFNQWGEKIFESRSQTTGWDGTHKGKVQPAGVYMYVARITLTDGKVMDLKGTINLVR